MSNHKSEEDRANECPSGDVLILLFAIVVAVGAVFFAAYLGEITYALHN